MHQETYGASWTQTLGYSKSALLEYDELNLYTLTHLSPALCHKSGQYSAE